MMVMILQIVIHAQVVDRRGCFLALQQRVAGRAPLVVVVVIVTVAVATVVVVVMRTGYSPTGGTSVVRSQSVQIRIGELAYNGKR